MWRPCLSVCDLLSSTKPFVGFTWNFCIGVLYKELSKLEFRDVLAQRESHLWTFVGSNQYFPNFVADLCEIRHYLRDFEFRENQLAESLNYGLQ